MIDVVLADIIATHMSLDADRVVIYNGRFDAPSDQGIYVILSNFRPQVVGVSNRFDPDTDEEVQRVTTYTTVDIDIVSRDTSALDRSHEVVLAIDSTYSRQKQEENEIRIFRTPNTVDLSAVEGSASLHRYQIPVIISSVETKRTAILPIDKFRDPEEVIDG